MASIGEIFGVVKLKGGQQFVRDFQGVTGRIKNEVGNVRTFLQSAFGGIVLADLNNAANELITSQRKLQAAAKLTNVDFGILQETADTTKRAFELTQKDSNDLTVSLTKLTQKAGDVSKTSLAIERLLDLGAAQGNNVEQTLIAIDQAILGIDEGTDKLFQKNPSVLYKEYADQIGTTAVKLDDQQKAQALLNAVLESGLKVQGEYQNFLESAPGQQAKFAARLKEVRAEFGLLLQRFTPVLEVATKWLTFLANSSETTKIFIASLVAAGVQLKVLQVALVGLNAALGPAGWLAAGIAAVALAFTAFSTSADSAADKLTKFQQRSDAFTTEKMRADLAKLDEQIAELEKEREVEPRRFVFVDNRIIRKREAWNRKIARLAEERELIAKRLAKIEEDRPKSGTLEALREERAVLESVTERYRQFVNERVTELRKEGDLESEALKKAEAEADARIALDKSVTASTVAEAQKRLEAVDAEIQSIEARLAAERKAEQERIAARKKAAEDAGKAAEKAKEEALKRAEKIAEAESDLAISARRRARRLQQEQYDRFLADQIDYANKSLAIFNEERARKLQAAERYAAQLFSQTEQIRGVFATLSDAFFTDIANKAKGMRGFWKVVLIEILDYLERKLVLAKIDTIIEGILSGGVTLGKDLPLLAGAAGLFEAAKAGIRSLAKGAVVTQPEIVQVGEAGPEVIAPFSEFRRFSDRLIEVSSRNTIDRVRTAAEEVRSRLLETEQIRTTIQGLAAFASPPLAAVAAARPSYAEISSGSQARERSSGTVNNLRTGDMSVNVNFSGPLHDRRTANKLTEDVLRPAIKRNLKKQGRLVNTDVLKKG